MSRFTIKVTPGQPGESTISELRVFDAGTLTGRAAVNDRGGASFVLLTDIPLAPPHSSGHRFCVCEGGDDALFSIAAMLGYDVLGPEFAEALAMQSDRQKQFRATLS